MKYDFDEIIDRRGTNALNTDGFRGYIFHAGPEKKFPYADDEFVRMWIADMEFSAPSAILDAIKARVDRRIFGYTSIFTDDYYQVFSKWCRDRYDWDFPREQLCTSPGIVPALYEIVADVTGPDDKVLITTPSYGSFKHVTLDNKRTLVTTELKCTDGVFSLDFDDFAAKAADPAVRLIIWCNPHNPTGHMWTEEELKKVADIVRKNNLWIVSDEIHCDLIRSGRKHIPLAKAMPDYDRLVTCTAPSKTFNIAGLQFSNIIIRSEELRCTYRKNDRIGQEVNPLSLAAAQAAYGSCGDWLEELKLYLDDNFAFVVDFLRENIPSAVCRIPESTYLAWVDFRATLPDVKDLSDFFANNAGVLLEGGNDLFVGNAEGFVRLNLAMPRSIIKTGMERIAEAVKKHNA
ncbi:MAG: PatB family C-S lyase [Selenomonadaceae bacterium]|nr:PatB family C-S lyase [Selenomonadaceae bacterium]